MYVKSLFVTRKYGLSLPPRSLSNLSFTYHLIQNCCLHRLASPSSILKYPPLGGQASAIDDDRAHFPSRNLATLLRPCRQPLVMATVLQAVFTYRHCSCPGVSRSLGLVNDRHTQQKSSNVFLKIDAIIVK